MTYADDVLRTLQSKRELNVKRQADGTYRMNNPLKIGSDSHGFVLTLHGDDKGAYFDHVDESGGSLFELGDFLGLQRPQKANAQDTKRPYVDIRDYATTHGVTVADLHRAGWQRVDYQGRPALSFPTQNGIRYRFLDAKKGEKPYTNVTGYKACWYGLDRAIEMAKKEDKALVLCNGEISTLSAQTYGVPAFALTSGEKSIPEHLLAELNTRWQGDIIIALDCDTKGRTTAEKIKAQLPKSKVADLGLTDGGDLADFCIIHQYDATNALTLIAVNPSLTDAQPLPTTPDTFSISDLVNVLRQLQTSQANDVKGVDMERLLDRAQNVISTARQAHGSVKVISAYEVAQDGKKGFLERLNNPSHLLGLTTGLRELDNMTLGLQQQKLYYFMATTNQGKSSLMRTLITALNAQARGLIVPTESGDRSYIDNLVAMIANEEYMTVLFPSRIPKTDPNYAKRLENIQIAYDLVNDNLGILQKGSPTVGNIRDALESGVYQWCIVDSLSNMGGVGSIYERTSANSKGLIEIAKDYDVALISTVQTGRNVKDRANKEPQSMDAKGAGDIEEDADWLGGVYNHQWWVDRNETEIDGQRYPQDTIKVTCLKDRWYGRGGSFCHLAWGRGGRLVNYHSARLNNVAG